ncbi:tyrosine-type recombinase/integrase [Fictibacillus norfolkensis]|uniref:Tyrosine-type recombinase/integrase n=1 Tax=Fictibacillus norfolkensis TaxID=2762233 RepID=A0ABR8SGE5_9BACL|nr:tyrosine-type recombinase/integrase [Fictibacillus norfolkensis]MBD7962528.1 tyrosine-type recombinase/integrase [Fictibacillus norfolkensis]
MNTAQPITDMKLIKDVMEVYRKGSKQYLLLAYSLNTGLRISDILRANVKDSLRGIWKNREEKTNKEKLIELNPKLQLLIRDYVVAEELAEGDYLFYSNKDRSKPISRVQAHRIVAHAGDMIGITLSCHSLRKTFGYMAYKQDVDLALLQYIFNHSSQAVTLRYIGITQDEANKVTTRLSIGI